MSKTYFTVGPSQLYPNIERYIQEGLAEGVGSIYHRSEAFRDIYSYTDEQLRRLMNIPKTHSIFFLASASEAWERILNNLVLKKSIHFVQGNFGERWYNYARDMQLSPERTFKPRGEGFEDIAALNLMQDPEVELICTTQNETSTGVLFPLEEMYRLKTLYPNALLCSDIVSSAPYVDIDYRQMDSSFFVVQKGFGLPAGLGVWVVNDRCLVRFQTIAAHKNISPHNRLDVLYENYQKKQTPFTPNVLLIYLLGRVAEDMNKRGIDNIRKETANKAQLLYDFLEHDSRFQILPKVQSLRSMTTLVASVIHGNNKNLLDKLAHQNIYISTGYRDYKNTEIRIGNFPSHTMEDMERLCCNL